MKLEKMIGVERQLSKRNKKGEFRAKSKKKLIVLRAKKWMLLSGKKES